MLWILRNGALASAVAIAVLASSGGAAYSAGPGPVAGGPAGVGACKTQASVVRSGATVADLQTFGDCEIARRLTTLDQLSAAVRASNGLTSSHAASLTGDIAAARSGLNGLSATLDSLTRLAPARAAILQIVNGYRVYLLLGPQVRLTIAADSELALKPHFDQLASTLADRISAAQAHGKDVRAAQTALAAMKSAVAAAAVVATAVPAKLLGLRAASYNLSSAALVKAARAAVIEARNDLKNAAQDGRGVLAALK